MKQKPETPTGTTRSREQMAWEVIITGRFIHRLRQGDARRVKEQVDWARVRLGVLFWALHKNLSRKEADEKATQWCWDILKADEEGEFINDLLHDVQQEMESYDGC